MPVRAKRLRLLMTALGGLIATAILYRLFARADGHALARAAASAGPLVFTSVLPFGLGTSLDAAGSIILLRALGRRVAWVEMILVRVASEALHATIPAGFIASDTATAMLLESRCDVPLQDGLVASIARKWLVMRTHSAYIAVGALAGGAALGVISQSLFGTSLLTWLVPASAVIPLALSLSLGAALLGRQTFSRLQATLAGLPIRPVARWAAGIRERAFATDAQVARLRASRSSLCLASLAFLGAWCLETLESALVLTLAGASIPLPSMFAIEAGLSLVRSAVVVAPSGLGAVDLGYASVLPALGVDPATAAAFVVMKRAKEAAWAALGYAILTTLRGRSQLAPAAATASAS